VCYSKEEEREGNAKLAPSSPPKMICYIREFAQWRRNMNMTWAHKVVQQENAILGRAWLAISARDLLMQDWAAGSKKPLVIVYYVPT
jgi:hypothetical protein